MVNTFYLCSLTMMNAAQQVVIYINTTHIAVKSLMNFTLRIVLKVAPHNF